MPESFATLLNKKAFFERIIDNLATNCIYLLLRLAKVAKKTPESFDYVLNYMNSVVSNNMTIKQIAYNLGYNYDYFRQLFLQKTGMTAKEYLLKAKLKLSITYFVSESRSVSVSPLTETVASNINKNSIFFFIF
ncbi:MAG: AraC family transcriptional regulator [Bacteroidaceae bacterium]|nr:AraC family transcriptional regulator [Bacteroidaceae bacterium]